jgi:integrase
VPIKHSLLPILQAWRDEDAQVGTEWVINYHGRQMHTIRDAWQRSLRRAGITRKIRPYDLRHAFATDAIAAGADVGTVAKLMGHSNVQMVLQHYQHVLTQQKKAAVEALPDMPMYDQGLYAQKENAPLQ